MNEQTQEPTADRTPETPRKRSLAKRLAEFALWAAVAIGTAAIMISLSEKLLPANF